MNFIAAYPIFADAVLAMAKLSKIYPSDFLTILYIPATDMFNLINLTAPPTEPLAPYDPQSMFAITANYQELITILNALLLGFADGQ